MTAVPTEIDRAAPVIAQHEIDIEAPSETVWQLHVDVNSWPSWHSDITEANLEGSLAPGASFDWTSYGFSVTSTVYDLSERARVLWGGSSGGITGVHEWRFEETSDGVHVTTSESFAGEPVEADAPGMQKLLDASLVAWLNALKVAAEQA